MTEYAEIRERAERLVRSLSGAGKTLATAESCTGGWIAKALTDIAGSSACFGYGVVSYSNPAKTALLGVDENTLGGHGAVSEAVVREMAAGAIERSAADFAVAVSGVAGPDGGTIDKPVGTVWFAWAGRSGDGVCIEAERRDFDGDRERVRLQSVAHALDGVRGRMQAERRP